MVRPPCLGFESFQVNVHLELFYERFNPRGSGQRSYQMRRIDYENCSGSILPTSAASAVGQMMAYDVSLISSLRSQPYKPPKDFPVDLMVLSGRASISNRFGSQPIALGNDVTKYKANPVDKVRSEQTQYDFDGDGKHDKTVLGHLVKVSTANGEEKEEFYQRTDAAHPCSPEPSATVLCDKQGVYLSSIGKQSGEPDLVRAADFQANLKHEGLLSEITPKDYSNTDIYVVRESNGQLIAERQGLPISEMQSSLKWYEGNTQDLGVDEERNRFFYTILLRGQGEGFYNEVTLNQTFNQWQAVGGVNQDLHKREADHPRPGERMKIIAINRATGYIGSITTTLQAAGSKTSSQISFPIDDIILRPPNLKIWAERAHTVAQGTTQGEERQQLIGSEGAGLNKDTKIVVYTEWLDHDDTPLPKALAAYGYTGRLAKVSGLNTLKAVDSAQLSQFPIKPGLQTQIIKLSAPESKGEHLYVQVSGESSGENPAFPFISNNPFVSNKEPDFTSSEQHEGVLKYRPINYVPVKVPVYDESNSLLQEQAFRLLKQNNPDPNFKPEKPEPVYQFVYRPEFQFSVFDLTMKEVQRKNEEINENLLTKPDALLSSSDQLFTLLYDLSGSTFAPLELFSGGRELVFAFGEEEMQAKVQENGKIVFDNVDHLGMMSADDLLTFRLYANNDSANILWEYGLGGSTGLKVAYALPTPEMEIKPDSTAVKTGEEGNDPSDMVAYRTLGGVRLKLEYRLKPGETFEKWSWNLPTDSVKKMGCFKDLKIVNAAGTEVSPAATCETMDQDSSPNVLRFYWQLDWPNATSEAELNNYESNKTVDTLLHVDLRKADGTKGVREIPIRFVRRELKPETDPTPSMAGDDVAMLEQMLWQLGLSPNKGRRGSRGIRIAELERKLFGSSDNSLNWMAKRFKGRSFEKSGAMGADGVFDAKMVAQLGRVWRDYQTAVENSANGNFTRDDIVKEWWEDFAESFQSGSVTWEEGGQGVLVSGGTYTEDRHSQMLTSIGASGVTRIDVLKAWTAHENLSHWGVNNTTYRISEGAADELGSIGFSQIQFGYLYGKNAECAAAKGNNLYRPYNNLMGFAVWGMGERCGMSFRRAYSTNQSKNFDVTFNNTNNVSAVLVGYGCKEENGTTACAKKGSDSLSPDDYDRLHKAIAGYNGDGNRLFKCSLPDAFAGVIKTVDDVPKDCGKPFGGSRDVFKIYSMEILHDKDKNSHYLKLPTRNYVWKVGTGPNAYCFAFGEKEWRSGLNWVDYLADVSNGIEDTVICPL